MPIVDEGSGHHREITQLAVGELTRLVLSRELSAEEVAVAHLQLIAEVNPAVNALVHVDSEHALSRSGPSRSATCAAARLRGRSPASRSW